MIDVGRSITSVGVGAVSEVLEWWDEKEGRVGSFRTANDIGNLVMCGVGYGAQVFMPRYAKLGETIALSATPLLVKSISRAIRSRSAAGARSGMGRVSFVPRGNPGGGQEERIIMGGGTAVIS